MVNSHTHDPISMGTWRPAPPQANCGLCNTEMDEEMLVPYDGYNACPDCVELEEQMKAENETDIIETSIKSGYVKAVMDIIKLPEIQGDHNQSIRIAIHDLAKLKTA